MLNLMTLMFREIDCHIILTRPAPEAKGRFTAKEPWNYKEDETEIATIKLKSEIMGLDPVLISTYVPVSSLVTFSSFFFSVFILVILQSSFEIPVFLAREDFNETFHAYERSSGYLNLNGSNAFKSFISACDLIDELN